jgi:hypothetical protein
MSGEISDEYQMERYRAIKMATEIEKSGVPYHTSSDEIVVKLPMKVLFGLVEDILHELADDDNYAVRKITSRYNTFFFLGLPLPGTEEHAAEDFFARNDLIRLTLSPSDREYDYELDREISTENKNDTTLRDSRDTVVLTTNYRIYGVEELVISFEAKLRERISEIQRHNKSSLVNWLYSSGHSTQRKVFQVNKTWDIHPSFYPWITKSLPEYYKAFMESNAQILVLWGPPGTGKTSWLRDMICEMNLNAFISYDTKVLTSDSTFVSYLLDPLFNAIILEDADDFLTATRSDNDKLISKILNISDGLIKLPQKKLIFSTNLPSVAQIDKAIIRPGRCFDVMEFRKLTHAEAKAAADHLGVNLESNKHAYTLAELFGLRIVQQATDPLLTSHGAKFDQGIGFLNR